MNQYKYHTNPETLLYNENDVMLSMIQEMIDFYDGLNAKALQNKDPHKFITPERDYAIEDWIRNGETSFAKDFAVDDYMDLMGLESEIVKSINGEYRYIIIDPDEYQDWYYHTMD